MRQFWQRSPLLVRRAAGLGLGTTLGAINGLGNACMETTLSAAQAGQTMWKSLRAGQPLAAARAFLTGLGEVLTSAVSPLYSNIAVGVRAGIELGRQMTEDTPHDFEMVYGAGNNLQFKSRIGNEVVVGGVVRNGMHSLYPEIHCTTLRIDRRQLPNTTLKIKRG